MTATDLSTDPARAASHDEFVRSKAQATYLAADLRELHPSASHVQKQHRLLAYLAAYAAINPHASETPAAYQARIRESVAATTPPDAFFQVSYLQLRHEKLPSTHTALQSNLQYEGAALRYNNITAAQINAHQLNCFRADLISPFPLPPDSYEGLAVEMRVNDGYDTAFVNVKDVPLYGRPEEDPAQPLVRSGDQQWLDGRSLFAYDDPTGTKHAGAGKGTLADPVENSVFTWRVELVRRTIAGVPHLVSIFVRPTGLPESSSLTLSLQHQRIAP